MNCKRVDLAVLESYKKGLPYIYPQNRHLWFACVEKGYSGRFQGNDIKIAIQFMETLETQGSVTQLYERVKKQMSVECFEKVLEIVVRFSKKGIQFYAWGMGSVLSRVLTCGQEKMLSKIARDNQNYEEELKNDDICQF